MARYFVEFLVIVVAFLLALEFIIFPLLKVLGFAPGSLLARVRMRTESKRQHAALAATKVVQDADAAVQGHIKQVATRSALTGLPQNTKELVERGGGTVPTPNNDHNEPAS